MCVLSCKRDHEINDPKKDVNILENISGGTLKCMHTGKYFWEHFEMYAYLENMIVLQSGWTTGKKHQEGKGGRVGGKWLVDQVPREKPRA